MLARFADAVSHACDRHFRDLVPLREGKDNLYTHLFRCVFASIAAYYYAPRTVSDIEFMAAAMGHFQILDRSNPVLRRSLVSVRHYRDYKIGDGKGNINGRQGIRLGLPGVKVIKMFRQNYQSNLVHVEATLGSDRAIATDEDTDTKNSFETKTKKIL